MHPPLAVVGSGKGGGYLRRVAIFADVLGILGICFASTWTARARGGIHTGNRAGNMLSDMFFRARLVEVFTVD